MAKSKKSKKSIEENEKFPLPPQYDEKDDIYTREKKVPIDEESQDDTDLAIPSADLDIPGAELDDPDEKIGNEDEENNYYSLGGDNHNDLEEDNE